MIDTKEKNLCSGCTACVHICPRKCISMKRDAQGFLYPVIDHDLCIECGACDRVCELASHDAVQGAPQRTFGVIANDSELQKNSSSGGVFSLLAGAVLQEKGVVAGAAMAPDQRTANHILIDSPDDLDKLRGAKYVQSDPGDIFPVIGNCLKEGRKVLFSGTPCQVDGLKAFLKEEDENLLCVDMICHGVPSPMIWEKYCDEIEAGEAGRIVSVRFRHKKYPSEKPSFENTQSGDILLYNTKNDDPYMRLFLNDYTLRPSCYSCAHKGLERKADITIADFWGVNKILPGFSNGAGTSLVIVHTQKGMKYLEAAAEQAQIQETDCETALSRNGSALRSAKRPADADAFWQKQSSMTVPGLADMFAPQNKKSALRSAVKKSAVFRLLKGEKNTAVEDGILFIIRKTEQ